MGPYSRDSCCPLCSYPYPHGTSKHSLLTHANPCTSSPTQTASLGHSQVPYLTHTQHPSLTHMASLARIHALFSIILPLHIRECLCHINALSVFMFASVCVCVCARAGACIYTSHTYMQCFGFKGKRSFETDGVLLSGISKLNTSFLLIYIILF